MIGAFYIRTCLFSFHYSPTNSFGRQDVEDADLRHNNSVSYHSLQTKTDTKKPTIEIR